MPFVRGLHNSSLGDPMNRLLYCTISNLCFNIKEVKGNADELMTGFLQEACKRDTQRHDSCSDCSGCVSGVAKISRH